MGAIAALAVPATAQEQDKTLQLAKVVLDTETSPIEARVKGGTWCVFPSNIELTKEKKTQDFERYDRLVSGKMAESGIKMITEADDLFSANSDSKGDILLGATMAPVAINICSSVDGYKGAIDVKVEWQFYDRKSQQVVERLETEGTGKIEKFSVNGYVEMWDAAFLDALDKVGKQGILARVLSGGTRADTAGPVPADTDAAAETPPAS